MAASARAEKNTVGQVVAGCHAAPVFQKANHDLDAVAPSVVFDGYQAEFLAWNGWLYALLLERVPESFGVLAPIGQMQ